MRRNMKHIALFDWDKTIRKDGYVIYDFIEILAKNNIIDKNIKNEMDMILSEHSEGKDTYTEFAKRVIKTYGKYISEVRTEDLKSSLEEFEELENKNNRIYSIMEQRIFPFLLERGIEPIIISGSPQEPIDLYKKRMNFQRAYAIQFEADNGKYTENCIVNTAIGEGKEIIVKELLKEEPETKIVFAFGDAEADIPLLVSAKQGFVNNSNRFLDRESIDYFDFDDIETGDKILKIMEDTIKLH